MYERTTYHIDPVTGRSLPKKSWQASRELLSSDGRRRRVTGSGRTPDEALARLEANYRAALLGTRPSKGRPRLLTSGSTQTVRDLFVAWDADNRKGRVSLTMAKKYHGYFEHHILPHIGDRPLQRLTTRDLEHLFSDILVSKTYTPKKSKSNPTPQARPMLGGPARRNVYMALSNCLAFGVRRGDLDFSPLAAVRPPSRKTARAPVVELSEKARDLLATLKASNDPDYCRWLFQFLGLRRAERLGLTWSRVHGLNTKSPSITIDRQLARREDVTGWQFKPTKNHGVRVLELSPLFAEALRAHKRRQDRQKKSGDWRPVEGFEDLVFLQPNGGIISLNRDNDDWRALLDRLGIPQYRGHGPRAVLVPVRFNPTCRGGAKPAISVKDQYCGARHIVTLPTLAQCHTPWT